MSCRRLSLSPGTLPTLVLLAAALASCSRSPSAPEFQRLAVLRFENLGADLAKDWVGRALSEMVIADLAGAPTVYAIPSSRVHGFERSAGARPISAPGVSAERQLAIVAGANRLGYGEFSVKDGRIRARLTVENLATGKAQSVVSAEAPATALAALAADLAHQLWAGAARIAAGDAALQAYAAALESNDPHDVIANLERAIAADPDFAPPYRPLSQFKAQSQDRAGASDLIRAALSRNLPASARAGLEFEAAALSGDRTARVSALGALARLQPSEPTVWRALAAALISAHRYPEAVAGYRKAAAIEPQDVASLNELAYACAYAGDLPCAVQALGRYRAERPTEANPYDSLGDVYLIAGRLADAEKAYLQAPERQPHFQMDGSLFKAAMARLMTGDVTGADALARRYFDARAAEKDPVLPYRQAEWSWASGRRREGFARMAEFAQGAASGPLRELSARAHAQLAIWDLAMGDRAHAAQLAETAAAEAGPASAAIAAVARFLAQPPATPAEWAARTDREFAQPQQAAVRDFSLAYALLLQKDFAAAAPVLKKIYDSGDQADGEGLPVLLAWTYLETGRTSEAAALVRDNPVPSISGTGPFLSFYFPRIYYLRAEIARRQSKTAEAAPQFRLFRTLSGPDSLIWGEESAAR